MLYCNTCGNLFEPTKGIEEHNCMTCCEQNFLETLKKHKDETKQLEDIAVGPIPNREVFGQVYYKMVEEGYEKSEETENEKFFEGGYLCASCPQLEDYEIVYCLGEEICKAKIIDPYKFLETKKEEKLAEEKEPSNIDSSLRGCSQDTSTEEECQAPASKQVAPSSEHYRGVVEPIDLIDAQGFGIGFCAGNAIKYLSRFDKKGTPILDIEKALWYTQHLLKLLKEGRDS